MSDLSHASTPRPSLAIPTLSFFKQYIGQFRWYVTVVIGLIVVGIALGRFQHFFMSRLIEYTKNHAQDSLFWKYGIELLIVIGVFSLSARMMYRFANFILAYFTPKLEALIKKNLFDHLHKHSVAYINSHFAGQLGHKINQVGQSSQYCLLIGIYGILNPLLLVTVTSFFIAFIHWKLAAAFLLWTLGYLGGSVLMAQRTRRLSRTYADQKSSTSGQVVDSITNALTVKSFANLAFEHQMLDAKLKQEIRSGQKSGYFSEWTRTFQAFMGMILLIMMLGLAMYLTTQKQIDTGNFVLIVTLVLEVLFFLWGLADELVWMFTHLGIVEDGLHTVTPPHDIVDQPNAKTLQVSRGGIEFKNVDFEYKGNAGIFKNLNLVIPPKQKVGLVGHSGAGKSTFVSLLLRYYDIQGGKILIDHQDIAHVTQESLRKQIAVIPQDTVLFHRNLTENIRYGKLDATDDEIAEAADRAHAGSFIGGLSSGYDTMVGERGVKLSGGQRQRIAIARAILKNAPILVLDEATSALDSESERNIQSSLFELMEDKTVIAIAHRLSTLLSMDRLLVFKDGAIVEDGTHEELLAKNGHYATLWSMQSGNFIGE